MTINQMRYFAAVCQYRNYSKAAETMHISQPAISTAVRELERECGVSLLIRSTSGLQITDEGLVLLQSIQPILQQCDSLNQTVSSLHLGRKYVRVGFITLMGSCVFSDLLMRFGQTHPEIQVVATENSSPQLMRMLENNELDAVVCGTQAENPLFGRIPITDVSMRFCVHREHLLAQKESVTWEEIAGVPLVLLTERFSITRNIEKTMHAENLMPNVIHRTDQVYTVERFIENNAAAGFLPAAVAARNPDIVGIPFPGGQEVLLEAYWNRNAYMFHAVKLFLDTVRAYRGNAV